MSSSDKADVVIVPGGWSSTRHYTRLRRLLKEVGLSSKIYRRRKDKPQGKIVITHSVGGMDAWEGIASQHVVILAPPYIHQKTVHRAELTRRWLASRKQETTFQRKHKRLIKSWGIPLWAAARTPADPYMFRYQYKLLYKDFVEKVMEFASANPNVSVLVIRYDGDVWTDSGLRKAFAGIRNVTFQVHQGPHDDMFYHPETYVKLIRQLQ